MLVDAWGGAWGHAWAISWSRSTGVVIAPSDGDEKRRRKREQGLLDEYRRRQERLREQIEAAFAQETGEAAPVAAIQAMPAPPPRAARLVSRLRTVETQIAQFDPWLARARQDEEDLFIITLLLS